MKARGAAGWVLAFVTSGGLVGAAPIATVQVAEGRLVVRPAVEAGSVSVAVSGPGDFVLSRHFPAGATPVLELTEDGGPLPEGQYFYEARLGLRAEDVAAARPAPPADARVVSGTFRVLGGRVLVPRAGELSETSSETERPVPPAPDDQVIADDLIVQGRTCVGADCVNAEPFLSADTLLLKQINNRIRVDDTTTNPGIPSNDWQLTFNDSAAGGASKFSLEDLTGATVPFTVVAGAPTNSLFVDASGRIGIGTNAPAQLIHAVNGNTPTVRLEQDGSGVGPPYAWDIFANHGNLIVQDVTANRTPFVIESSAPANALEIKANGDVGVGVPLAGATASLHVFRTNGTTQLRVEEATTTTASRNMLRIINNGASTFRFDNTLDGSAWGFGSRGTGDFFIGKTPGQTFAFNLTSAGNLTITGALTQGSDRGAKDDIAAVDPRDVLARVAQLPIATWRYKGDDATHVGPMAQDFHAAFGLGEDDKHIAPGDMAGLGLAAIQALRAEQQSLAARLEAREAELDAREARVARLEERLAMLEAALSGDLDQR